MEWGELYALLICETGWTYEYVDNRMTLPRFRDFIDHWRDAPPLRVALSALLGAAGGKKAKVQGDSTSIKETADSELARTIEELSALGIPLETRRGGQQYPS